MKNVVAAAALAAVAAVAVAFAVVPSDSDASTASDRQAGTVKSVVEASAGDKKVEVIK
ncbi:hypothetical protein OG897_28580 [Streptomyces sp. NBC_00237]|uniref:hypothetical protein n=1 Tax=Streptomyces sp. NBC_00237 TaxID=2975687 RepID=UPI00225273D1|nr:hypothetical protein [Streptomyces sp. NBC_00237]MCX5205403.1 hypothetical protein [Streptomyces sp. NBC_00237]